MDKYNTRPDKFTLNAVADPLGGGRVYHYPDSAYYASGAFVILATVANPGYKFAGWSGDTALVADEDFFVYRVRRDVVFTAEFEPSPE